MTDEMTPEQEQQVADDAFAAAFNEVRGDEPEALEPVKAAEPESAPEPDDPELLAAIAEDKPDPRFDAIMARLAEVDRVRSGYDKLAGHVGTIMQRLQEMQTPPKSAEPEVTLPKVDPKEFAESYPEFASYLRDQLAAVAGAQMPPDVAQRLQASEARSAELEARLEERTISFMHPDWGEVVNSQGYQQWLGQQPEDVQKTARESPYAHDLGRVLTAYKSTAQKAQQQQQRKQRLEQALPPSAVQQTPKVEPTEDEAFASGWSSVRGRGV